MKIEGVRDTMAHKHDKNHPGPCHHAEVPRLRRIAGQVEGIRRMIEEDRSCADILAQLRAARAALKTVEANVLETHLRSCVTEAFEQGGAEAMEDKIAELKDLFKRFEA